MKRHPGATLVSRGPAVIESGKKTTIVCHVRSKYLKVTANSRTLIEWKNPPYDTATTRLPVTNPNSLFLAARYPSQFRISRIGLTPISGGAPKRLRMTGASGGVISPIGGKKKKK